MRACLATAGAAPGSIIAAIIVTQAAAKNPKEPGRVVTPMSMPSISQAAAAQHAAASPSVDASTIAGTGRRRTSTFTIGPPIGCADPVTSVTRIRERAGRGDLAARQAGYPSREPARPGTAALPASAQTAAGTAPGAAHPARRSPGPPRPAGPGAWRLPGG